MHETDHIRSLFLTGDHGNPFRIIGAERKTVQATFRKKPWEIPPKANLGNRASVVCNCNNCCNDLKNSSAFEDVKIKMSQGRAPRHSDPCFTSHCPSPFKLLFFSYVTSITPQKMVTGMQVVTASQVQITGIGCRWQAISSCP